MNRDRFKFYMDELDLVDEQTRRQIGILACCEGLIPTYDGYVWRYKK